MMDYEIKDGVAIIPEGTEKINLAWNLMLATTFLR